MPKRIHDLAKELGIKSKAIIERCIAEGVPAEKVKNHMATLSLGLEATIREWFTTDPRYFEGRELVLVIDPGTASKEALGEFLYEISKLHRMLGGAGVSFEIEDIRQPALELV